MTTPLNFGIGKVNRSNKENSRKPVIWLEILQCGKRKGERKTERKENVAENGIKHGNTQYDIISLKRIIAAMLPSEAKKNVLFKMRKYSVEFFMRKACSAG